MHRLSISTRSREQIVDITPKIRDFITKEKLKSGVISVYSPHTTACITVNENADPDVKKDISNFLSQKIPKNANYSHTEGNADSHIKGSLMGFSQIFIVESGKLQLGTWQGIFFMEFDGPRSREVWLKFIPV